MIPPGGRERVRSANRHRVACNYFSSAVLKVQVAVPPARVDTQVLSGYITLLLVLITWYSDL